MAIAAYTKSCTKNVGGNSAVYLTEAANITTVTVTSGEISAAITMGSGLTFHEVQADLDNDIKEASQALALRNGFAIESPVLGKVVSMVSSVAFSICYLTTLFV